MRNLSITLRLQECFVPKRASKFSLKRQIYIIFGILNQEERSFTKLLEQGRDCGTVCSSASFPISLAAVYLILDFIKLESKLKEEVCTTSSV